MAVDIYHKGVNSIKYEYSGTILTAIFQFLVSVLLVKKLTMYDYGIFNILFMILSFVGTATFFVIPPLTRYLPELHAVKEYLLMKKIVWQGLIVRLFSGILMALVFLISPQLLGYLLNISAPYQYLIIFSFIGILSLMTDVIVSSLSALLEQKATNLSRVAYYALFFAFSYFLLFSGYGLMGVFLSMLFARLIFFLAVFIRSCAVIFTLPDAGKKTCAESALERYTWIQYLTVISNLAVTLPMSIYLVTYFFGIEAAAAFSFATQMPQYLLALIPSSIAANVFFPILVGKYTIHKNRRYLEMFFEFYNRLIAFFVFPAVLGAVILHREIISWVFDPKYLPSSQIFVVSLVTFGVWAFGGPTAQIYNALNKPEIGLYSKVIVLYSIVSSIFLIPRYGFMGAIFPIITSIVFIIIFEFYMTCKFISLTYPLTSFLKSSLASLAMGAALLYFKSSITSIYSFFFIIAVGGSIYAVAAFILKPLKEDHDLFKRIGSIGRIFSHF